MSALVHPLDTFSMYSSMPTGQSSHLLARDEDGNVHTITSFRSFDCESVRAWRKDAESSEQP